MRLVLAWARMSKYVKSLVAGAVCCEPVNRPGAARLDGEDLALFIGILAIRNGNGQNSSWLAS
jgi:hypothetical protein